jgi:2,4-dienoyl-CoA reductase-like NADH-dependent reductase (Old Yellow Enzyme family)
MGVDPYAPAQLGPVTLRNRIIKGATFEGVTRKNVVTDELVEYHRKVAAGGVGMTTVAYCAVSREGSTDGRTIVLEPKAVDGLARLVDAMHAEGAAVAAQIGHAGAVANPMATRVPAMGPSKIFSPLGMRWTKAATDGDLERIRQEYADGAARLAEAGMDAIEIHIGHGYLLSSFLSPKLNNRKDRYGGSLENRARFPREVVAAVREAAGPTVAVTAKLNMTDGVKKGFDVDESLQFAKWLEQDGHLDALALTGGSSLQNPMYLFKGDAPVEEMGAFMPKPVRPFFKYIGPRFFHEYPFEEAYFLPLARRFREALDMPLIYLGGINRPETVQLAMDEGFQLVAMARALLREPNLISRWQSGDEHTATCIHCNKCMPSIYTGTRCVIDHPKPPPAKPKAA